MYRIHPALDQTFISKFFSEPASYFSTLQLLFFKPCIWLDAYQSEQNHLVLVPMLY